MEAASSMVKNELRNKNAGQVLDKASVVLKRMNGNVHFPLPQPKIERVQILAAKLRGMLEQPTPLPVVVRKAVLKDLCHALSSLAGWVQVVSQGDSTIILSTGFNVRKRRSKAHTRPAPVIKRCIKVAKTGCVKLMWQADVLAKCYSVYITDENNPGKKRKATTSTKSSAIISGLESGKRYRLQVSCINSAGEGPLSCEIVVCEGWA
jgi:hypothetical protein